MGCVDFRREFSVMDQADLIVFSRVLYHLSTTKCVSEETLPDIQEEDVIVKIFERLKSRRDVVLLIRCNPLRRECAEKDKSQPHKPVGRGARQR